MDKLIEKFNIFSEKYLPKIGETILFFIIGIIVIKFFLKFLRNLFAKSRIEKTITTFLYSIIKIIICIVFIITILSSLGVNVTSIITTFAAAAVAAGLAIQDSLQNVVSGVVIFINKPFVAGDTLEFEGVKGKVQNIRIFSTQIHTFDNKIVTIPNSRLTSNNITNCTMVDQRRVDLSYTIGYDDDIDKVKKILKELALKNEKVIKDPTPSVHVGKHLESGIEIVTWVWVNPDDYYDVYFYMQENVLKEFKNNNITIPYKHIQLIQ